MKKDNSKRTIVTYKVPVTLTNEGSLKLHEERKERHGLPEEVTLEKFSDIGKLATDVSQENTRVKEVARRAMKVGASSEIYLKYIE